MHPLFRRRSERGSVLIEAFIAMLLFSIGILGIVGLQATATRNSTDARYRVEAAYLAHQIIGQMWADDRANLPSYRHNPTASAACNFGGGASTNPHVTAWIGGDDHIPGTVAHTLPGSIPSRQQITVDANNVVTVTLCWLGPGETVPHRLTTVAQIG
jgi:type IV pilus assembly protein PilV